MEPKAPAAWLGRKDTSIISEFVSTFIHQVRGRGEKGARHLKECTLAVGKGWEEVQKAALGWAQPTPVAWWWA